MRISLNQQKLADSVILALTAASQMKILPEYDWAGAWSNPKEHAQWLELIRTGSSCAQPESDLEFAMKSFCLAVKDKAEGSDMVANGAMMSAHNSLGMFLAEAVPDISNNQLVLLLKKAQEAFDERVRSRERSQSNT